MAFRILAELQRVEKEARNLIKENAVSGKLFRQAAEEGNLFAVQFFLSAKDRYELLSLETLKCRNKGAEDENGTTPLHLAALKGHIGIVHTLLTAGAHVNAQNKKRETPLYMASRGGHKNVVNFLLSKGADPYHCTLNEEKMPIDIAASGGHWDIVECMLNSKGTFPSEFNVRKWIIDGFVDPNIVDEWGFTLLHKAVDVEGVQLVHYLLQSNVLLHARSITYGETPLHSACFHGRNDIVRVLIEHGASVNTKSGKNLPPLYVSIRRNNSEVIKTLLESGADVNMRCGDCDETVLHHAVSSEMMDIARVFVDWGADVNAKDKDDFTPLHYAALASDISLLQLLLRRGATINALNIRGETPLHYALDKRVREFLLLNGADQTISMVRRSMLSRTRQIYRRSFF